MIRSEGSFHLLEFLIHLLDFEIVHSNHQSKMEIYIIR